MGITVKIFEPCLVYPILTIWSAHLNLLDLIILKMTKLAERGKICITRCKVSSAVFLLCLKYPPPHVTS